MLTGHGELPQQIALEELKKRMTSDAVIAYFDPSKKTEVVVDASPVGLGAVLVQKHNEESKVVAYASRSLTNTETPIFPSLSVRR